MHRHAATKSVFLQLRIAAPADASVVKKGHRLQALRN